MSFDDYYDAGEVAEWTGLPRGEGLELTVFTTRFHHTWTLDLPSPPRTFVIPPAGNLTLDVLDLAPGNRQSDLLLEELRVTLVPLFEPAPKPVLASGQLTFGGLQPGLWRVELSSPERSWTPVLVEIHDRASRRVLFR